MSFATERTMFYPVAVDMLSKIKHIDDINQKMIIVFTTILQAGSQGLTIREVSEKCDMTVYASRNWLIRLEKKRLIHRSNNTRNAKWCRN